MTKDIVGRLADAMVAHVQQVLHDYGIPDDTIRNDPEIASATREAVSSALESLSPPDGVGLTRYGQRVAEFDNAFWVEADKDPEGDWVRHEDATAALAAKETERAEAEERIEVLELDAGRISAEFEGDLWKAIRHVVESNPGFTWGDYEPEGMTADDVATLFSEDMAAAWADVERFKARAEKAEAERDALKAALAPFAEALDEDDFADERLLDRDEIWEHPVAMRITFKHLRDAKRAALSPAQGGE